MSYRVVSLNIGMPVTLHSEFGEVETAIRKQPVTSRVYLDTLNFNGDQQADQKHHGGVDKAVCLYPHQHYAYWESFYQRTFRIPAFGENLTVSGVSEHNTHIGDIYKLGEAELQVTQPRQPCYKITRNHDIEGFPTEVIKTGYTGFYLRVLKPGYVSPEDQMKRVHIDNAKVTISEVNDVKYDGNIHADELERVMAVEALAESLYDSLKRNL
ncbi:MOSC domain-containing protein [Thalassobacillus sp. CUG 92003]|uniref:MOSC domain-containing protein n=1 Tax=Thalassobacillus sp. CUG 92003 TaxID=2736641 RepID=UPI0015E69D83|nr:MOSC domain-containing protein [Thalassobacillus sp. CUG 92003]